MIFVCVVPYVTCRMLTSRIPDQICIREKECKSINFHVPIKFDMETSGQIIQSVNFSNPISFTANEPGEYKVNMKLFGLFDVKTFTVNVLSKTSIIPCGFPVGIYLKTDGVLIVDTSEFVNIDGQNVNPCKDILYPGDYILSVNGEPLTSKTMFMNKVETCDGNTLNIVVRRDGNDFELAITPMKDVMGNYKTGLWIKDDSQGIGTLTYITDEGDFGALGHGISDSDIGEILKTNAGILYKAKILSISKGKKGHPGEFVGSINYSESNRIGNIYKNEGNGVYGRIDNVSQLKDEYGLQTKEIHFKEDVHKGKAIIQSCVTGSIEQYEIEITDVSIDDKDNKNITFAVTDKRLLNITNGIVQGMSGSPILQDDYVIGAVTHVFVDDSKSGYGIFIENMLH